MEGTHKEAPTEKDLEDLSTKYMLGELADLWMLAGIGTQDDGTMGVDWEKRANIFEGMIMALSPRHAGYVRTNDDSSTKENNQRPEARDNSAES